MSAIGKTTGNESYKEIKIVCPACNASKTLKMPVKIINQNIQLTTVGIPSNLICKHSFQAFIDKNFKVRGYQKVDFEISKMEFYEDNLSALEGEQKGEEELIDYNFSVIFKKIINLLRIFFIDKNILGGALFSAKGKALYSSLPQEIYSDTIKEFERDEKQTKNLKNIILIMDNNQKIFSEYIELQNIKLILVVVFSPEVRLNAGDIFIKELSIKIKDLSTTKKVEKIEPSSYWIYSKILPDSLQKSANNIKLDSLGIHVSKSVILNIKEITEIAKKQPFEGKVYFTEKFVKLMEGLALTLKDASIFINNLNKLL